MIMEIIKKYNFHAASEYRNQSEIHIVLKTEVEYILS
jgi:hypothetical protein